MLVGGALSSGHFALPYLSNRHIILYYISALYRKVDMTPAYYDIKLLSLSQIKLHLFVIFLGVYVVVNFHQLLGSQ